MKRVRPAARRAGAAEAELGVIGEREATAALARASSAKVSAST